MKRLTITLITLLGLNCGDGQVAVGPSSGAGYFWEPASCDYQNNDPENYCVNGRCIADDLCVCDPGWTFGRYGGCTVRVIDAGDPSGSADFNPATCDENADCGNGACDDDGYCVCLPGYTYNRQGLCTEEFPDAAQPELPDAGPEPDAMPDKPDASGQAGVTEREFLLEIYERYTNHSDCYEATEGDCNTASDADDPVFSCVWDYLSQINLVKRPECLPERNINRSDVIAVIINQVDRHHIGYEPGDPTFTDLVNPSRIKNIEYAVQLGLFAVVDTEFRPDDEATQEFVDEVFWNEARLPDAGRLTVFATTPEGEWELIYMPEGFDGPEERSISDPLRGGHPGLGLGWGHWRIKQLDVPTPAGSDLPIDFIMAPNFSTFTTQLAWESAEGVDVRSLSLDVPGPQAFYRDGDTVIFDFQFVNRGSGPQDVYLQHTASGTDYNLQPPTSGDCIEIDGNTACFHRTVPAGETAMGRYVVVLAHPLRPASEFTLEVCLTAPGEAAEQLADNCQSRSVTVQSSIPNLRVGSLLLTPSTFSPGGLPTLRWSVDNVGQGNSDVQIVEATITGPLEGLDAPTGCTLSGQDNVWTMNCRLTDLILPGGSNHEQSLWGVSPFPEARPGDPVTVDLCVNAPNQGQHCASISTTVASEGVPQHSVLTLGSSVGTPAYAYREIPFQWLIANMEGVSDAEDTVFTVTYDINQLYSWALPSGCTEGVQGIIECQYGRVPAGNPPLQMDHSFSSTVDGPFTTTVEGCLTASNAMQSLCVPHVIDVQPQLNNQPQQEVQLSETVPAFVTVNDPTEATTALCTWHTATAKSQFLTSLNYRIYASNNNFTSSATGNVAANQIITQVDLLVADQLVQTDNILSRREVGGDRNQFDPDSGDFFSAGFYGDESSPLVRWLEGESVEVCIKLHWSQYSNPENIEVAIGLDPSEDLWGQGDEFWGINFSGDPINMSSLHSPLIAIDFSPSLSIFSYPNGSGVVLPGERVPCGTDEIVAYGGDQVLEAAMWVNDPDGHFGDNRVDPEVIEEVEFSIWGATNQNFTLPMNDGYVRMDGQNLDLYRFGSIIINRTCVIKDVIAESEYGKPIRLGLMNVGNALSTFRVSTEGVQRSFQRVRYVNGYDGPTHVTLYARPVFTSDTCGLTNLADGLQDILCWTVNREGGINGTRIQAVAYDVQAQDVLIDGVGMGIGNSGSNFRWSDESEFTGASAMWHNPETGESCYASKTVADGGMGMACDGTSAAAGVLIVTLSTGIGSTPGFNSVRLKMNLQGVTSSSRLSVRMINGDQSSPLSLAGGAMQGQLHTGSEEPELFAAPTGYAGVRRTEDTSNLNLVWRPYGRFDSDGGVSLRVLPGPVPSVVPETGPETFTNGFGIDVSHIQVTLHGN